MISIFLFAQQEALSLILLLILETENAGVCKFREGLGMCGRVEMPFSSARKSRKKVNDKGLWEFCDWVPFGNFGAL